MSAAAKPAKQARKRPKKKKASPEEEASQPFSFTRMIGRFALTCAALLMIAFLAVMTIPRTDGFCYALEQYLVDRTGYPVQFDRTYLDWNFDLVVEGGHLGVPEEGVQGGLGIDRAVIKWSPRSFFDSDVERIQGIELTGCSLVFVPGEKGGWEPAALAEVGGWMNQWIGFDIAALDSEEAAAEAAAEAAPKKKSKETSSEDLFEKCPVTLRDGRITWRDASGKVEAYLHGVDLSFTPFQSPKRVYPHIFLQVETAQTRKRGSMKNVNLEMMVTGTSKILLGFTSEPGDPPLPPHRGPAKGVTQEKTREKNDVAAASEAAEALERKLEQGEADEGLIRDVLLESISN